MTFLLLLLNLLPLPTATIIDPTAAVVPVFDAPSVDSEIVGLIGKPDCTDIDTSIPPAYVTDLGAWNAASGGGGWVFNPGWCV